MKYFRFLPLFVALIGLSACVQFSAKAQREIASLVAPERLDGIWVLQGTHSLRGPYNGELELRRGQDGTFDVVRMITYINYYFEGYKVQEVWTGKAVADTKALTISYTLKQGDYITRLGNFRRAPADFKTKLHILERFETTERGLAAQMTERNDATYAEWLTARRGLEEKPLWKDERTRLDAKGPKIPLIVRGVIKGVKMKIRYEKDPLVKSYKDRPEYKNEQPYVIFDPTDYEFYQNTKDTLRVGNKVTDDISLTETLVRRHAYAPSFVEKAQGFEKNARENHINDAGMYVSQRVDKNTHQALGELPEGDATLWTGMYVGSQAMRYLLTQDKEALENVMKSTRAMFILIDITGDPKEFARTLSANDPQKPLPTNEWHRGKGPYAHLIWREGGNNDMIKGITHSFLWASLVVPKSETEFWKALKESSQRLIDLKVISEKPQNRPIALGLAALINEDQELRKKYIKSYNNPRVRLTGYSFDTSFYWHGSADWSGINLGMVGNITAILLAEHLGAYDIRDQLRERMVDEWLVYRPTRRHLQTMATHAFAYRHGTRGNRFRKESNEVEFERALKHSLWGLREIPYPRPTFLDIDWDHSQNPEWSMSPIPRLFWKAVKKPEPPVEYFYQGLYSYPIFEQDALDSTFIWKEGAFSYRGSHKSGVENSGVDYLYAYWLARYGGIISK